MTYNVFGGTLNHTLLLNRKWQVFSIGTVAVYSADKCLQIQCFSGIQNTGTVPILKSFANAA